MATTTIGLDIGSSAVRAVQVTSGGAGASPVLDRVGQVVLPIGAVRDGEVVDPEAVADALRTLWTRYGFKLRRVYLGLANQQVVVRQLDLPYLPDSELRQSLPFQVQDAIPIAVDQAILDYHPIEHFEADDGGRFTRLLLVAAQHQMVATLVDVVQRAKLDPLGLDLDAFAMLRSLAPEQSVVAREGQLIIDVGSAVTNIVVHEGGVPRFVRILLMGGNAITEALMDRLGMTFDEAEELKARTGLVSEYRIENDESRRVIAERGNRFIDEIRGSLDYYRAQPGSVAVRDVIISGGGSRLEGLQERLADTLRLDVDRGHPMASLRIGDTGLDAEQLQEAEAHLAVAVGLALGGLGL